MQPRTGGLSQTGHDRCRRADVNNPSGGSLLGKLVTKPWRHKLGLVIVLCFVLSGGVGMVRWCRFAVGSAEMHSTDGQAITVFEVVNCKASLHQDATRRKGSPSS